MKISICNNISRAMVLFAALALCAGGAFAAVPVPTAVWDGNFSTKKVNGWTLDENGNTISPNYGTITITSSSDGAIGGIKLTPATALAGGTGITVIMKVSGITQNDTTGQVLISATQGGTNLKTGIAVAEGSMAMYGSWNGNVKWNDTNNGNTEFSIPTEGEYYIAFTSGDGSSYVNECLYSNGTLKSKEINGLRDSGNNISMISIGGRPASNAAQLAGAVISRIMIYTGCKSTPDIKDAIEDMESTLSYSLPNANPSSNNGDLARANFLIPNASHFTVSGSATLNSAKALRQITIPWRSSSFSGTASYLGVTDASGKLLAVSKAADTSTQAAGSSTAFDFTQSYIEDNVQYKYFFLSSAPALGSVLQDSDGVKIGCGLYNAGSAVESLRSNTMANYSPAARYWVSNMTATELTATAEGTAISPTDSFSDVTLKGTDGGNFTVAGDLKVARLAVADAAATVKLSEGASLTAQRIDNASQTLTIDASALSTESGSHVVASFASLASEDNLLVTWPNPGDGYEIHTSKTATSISYTVARTSVQATLTLTEDTSFSSKVEELNWLDSTYSSLTVVNNTEETLVLTIDQAITAGYLVVQGTGPTVIDFGTEASSIDALSGQDSTVFKWRGNYPACIPNGLTYEYVGSSDEASPAAVSVSANSGTLKTQGYVNLQLTSQTATAALDVVSGKTSLSSGAGLAGAVTVESGAELAFANGDVPNYNAALTANVYGTLSCGAFRQSIGASHTFIFYTGSTITGSGDGNNQNDSTFDYIATNANTQFRLADGAESGTVTFNAPVSMRGSSQVTWTVDDGVSVVWRGDETKGCTSANASQCNGYLVKAGAGTLSLAGVMNRGTLWHQAGVVDVAVSQELNLAIAHSSDALLSVASGAVATGTISLAPTTDTKFIVPAESVRTILKDSSKWQGTLSIPSSSAAGEYNLADFGNASSRIVLNGTTGNSWVVGSQTSKTVAAEVEIAGNVEFNNGGSGMEVIFNKIVCTDSTKSFSIKSWDNSKGATYVINTLDEFAGQLNVVTVATTSGTLEVRIGNVVKAEYEYGVALVSATVSNAGGGTATLNLANTTLNGEAAHLVFDTDGIYLAEAAYAGTNYKTVQDAIDAAGDANLSGVSIFRADAEIPSGYLRVGANGIRKTPGLIYWNPANTGGDWSGAGDNSITFLAAEDGTDTTQYVDGDTVAFISYAQIWSKTSAHGVNFQIGSDSHSVDVHFTRSGDGCDDYILDGSTIEVKNGSSLIVERYGLNSAGTAYDAWNSYEQSHPKASAIKDTVITGAGSVVVGGNTGGHGAVTLALAGSTSITAPIVFRPDTALTIASAYDFGTVTLEGATTIEVAESFEITTGTKIIGWTSLIGAGSFSAGETLAEKLGDLALTPSTDGLYALAAIPADIGYWDGGTAVITNTADTVTIPAAAVAAKVYPTGGTFAIIATESQLQANFLSVYAKYEGGEQLVTDAFAVSVPSQVDGGLRITLTLSGTNGSIATSASVDGETVYVVPHLDTSGESLPVDVEAGDGTLTFSVKVKTIPGLSTAFPLLLKRPAPTLETPLPSSKPPLPPPR